MKYIALILTTLYLTSCTNVSYNQHLNSLDIKNFIHNPTQSKENQINLDL